MFNLVAAGVPSLRLSHSQVYHTRPLASLSVPGSSIGVMFTVTTAITLTIVIVATTNTATFTNFGFKTH